MTAPRQFIKLSLTAFCSLLLLGACASNSPSPKSAPRESANGPEGRSGSTKTSDRSDVVEEDNGDETAPPTKTATNDSKDKPAANKASATAPVDDSRTTASIQKVINENRPRFKKCYEDERKKAQDLKGTVVLELTLDADGKIKSAGVDTDESTIKLRAVTDCIVRVAQGLKYPASSKGLDKDFRYEFGFNNH
jgi:hypothetical protein